MLGVHTRIASIHSMQCHNKIRKFPLLFVLLNYRKNFVRTQKRVRIGHGKLAIGDRAIEVRLHIQPTLVISKSKDSMEHFEISVLRHIRFAELRKTINRKTTFNRLNL